MRINNPNYVAVFEMFCRCGRDFLNFCEIKYEGLKIKLLFLILTQGISLCPVPDHPIHPDTKKAKIFYSSEFIHEAVCEAHGVTSKAR